MKAERRVPFFDYPRVYLDDREDLLKIFEEVGHRGAFILQKDLDEFEKSLANFVQAKYSIGVANATDGLELSLMSIGLEKGDEVIICSHTMLATASAIITAGGTPVPVELGDDNLIDPQAIDDAISSRTVGIMPTQLNGRTCKMDKIIRTAEKNDLFVVEDAAQALGSKFKGKYAGTFGLASAISFFPAKVLGCLGDGGAVITNNDDAYDKIYQLHDHGRDTEGNVKSWGRNSRLDNLQAAILSHRLEIYENHIQRRREVASLYQEKLENVKELKLPPAPNSNPDHFDVYQNYEIEAENRDNLKEYLDSKNIGTLIQWGGKGVHQWENLDFNIKLPKVERFFERCIMLPMNVFISNEDIEYISESIKSFYTKY